MLFDFDKIQKLYLDLPISISKIREKLNKPLTLTEKILYSHQTLDLESMLNGKRETQAELAKEVSSVNNHFRSHKVVFFPDRVAIRDSNAQMTLLQFAASGKVRTCVPASVHCDQFVVAEIGSAEDLARAHLEHREVYDFLQSVSGKYGLGFWKPGSGIMHQVVLENYAFPGAILVGTDAHISNAGGLGMLGLAVGASDIVGALAGMPLDIEFPRVIAVRLNGKLPPWTSPKDVALRLWEILAEKNVADAVLEYIGDGAATLSCCGKATICNMGAEAGVSASLFPYDTKMAAYLIATGRSVIADLANGVEEHLKADLSVVNSPNEYYSEVLTIDLSTLEPRISGPSGIQKSWPLSEFYGVLRQGSFPEKLSVSLIGSCVNSSYEDMGKVSCIARQAWKHGLKIKSGLMVTPGSEMTRSTLERNGHLKALEEIGGTMLASACGPCAGLWKRHDVAFGEKNSILTTFNRSFSGRFDGNPGTQAFVASPEIAVAIALAGRLTFNPLTDALITGQGLPIRFAAPESEELPAEGFDTRHFGYVAPMEDNFDVPIAIDSDSKRLQLLKPFEPWNEKDFTDMRMLVKAAGKSVAEHISPGGKWHKLRGHLDAVSESMGQLLANSCREEIGKGKNLLSGEIESFAKIARDYKKEGISWVIVAEENFGEGTSCELVAMMPRYLGCKMVIAKSFANACEINLKRQGLLALTFARWEDYEKVREDDFLNLLDIREMAFEKPLELELKHMDGTIERIPLLHSYDAVQIQWFKAGSALNSVR